jgi:seryl-tRNA synthetase
VAQKVATELEELEAKRQRLKAAYQELVKPSNKDTKTLLAEVERVTRRESQLAAELERVPCPFCRVSLSDARARCYTAI